MKRVTTTELSQMFDRIIDKLNKEKIENIDIETDYYRIIPSDEWSNFTQDVIEVGSLNDDIESLKRLIENSNRPCTYVDFDRLASLLRAISQKNNPV